MWPRLRASDATVELTALFLVAAVTAFSESSARSAGTSKNATAIVANNRHPDFIVASPIVPTHLRSGALRPASQPSNSAGRAFSHGIRGSLALCQAP